MDNLGRAYDVSVDILSEKVWYFYIFPYFFLKVARENDMEIYLDLLQDRAETKRRKEEYTSRINKLVEIYLAEVEELREKSDIIAKWVDAEDPLAFFQERMSMQKLSSFRAVSKEFVKELDVQLSNGKITVIEAIEQVNIIL